MTVAELHERYPNAHFIKTKNLVERPNIGLMMEAFIPDADTPEFPVNPFDHSEKTTIYPLSVTVYPGVLSRMTAMEAGAWAASKCKQQKWELSKDNIEACLANLEMDF